MKTKEQYLNEFCEKQDCGIEFVVSNDIVMISDYMFKFEDIKFDIDNFVPKGIIFDWHIQNIEKEESIRYKDYVNYLIN